MTKEEAIKTLKENIKKGDNLHSIKSYFSKRYDETHPS
jgi:hypothetical protein